jgi:hypothetical protein
MIIMLCALDAEKLEKNDDTRKVSLLYQTNEREIE